MARFMLMIKGTKQSETGKLPSAELLTRMGKFNEELMASGALLSGEGLHPTSQGFMLTNVGGKLTITDGPFTEAKEIVAGYWILKLNSLAEAIAWAKKVPFEAGAVSDDPSAKGQIEVRAIMDFESPPGEQACANSANFSTETTPPKITNEKPKRTYRYFMAFKATPASEAGTPPTEKKMAEMGALMGEMAQAGILRGGEGLLPSRLGARVYYESGKRSVVDGPFAETKELIAGLCIIEVASKDEALAWAKRGVLVEGDSVSEVRRIYDAADFGDLQQQVPAVFEKERAFRASTQS